MGLIAIYKTECNEYGYRTIPLSFEYSWKVGDRIKTEDGTDSCTILLIDCDSKENVKLFNEFVKRNKPVSIPKLVIYDKKNSIEDQIKSLREEAVTTKGKLLLDRYHCTQDDICLENINGCFTKVVTSGPEYFCRLIRKTDENEMTEADWKRIIPSNFFIFGPILALFERDYKMDMFGDGFGFIKDDIEYTLQIVQSLSLESILKRLRRYKDEKSYLEKLKQNEDAQKKRTAQLKQNEPTNKKNKINVVFEYQIKELVRRNMIFEAILLVKKELKLGHKKSLAFVNKFR